METKGEANTRGAEAGASGGGRPPLPAKLREIEVRLQFPYKRVLRRNQSLSHWTWLSTVSDFSARVYPDPDRGTITVAVFDERARCPIKEWSG